MKRYILLGTILILAGCVDNPSDDFSAPTLSELTIVTGTDPEPGIELAAADFADAVEVSSGFRPAIVETVTGASTRGVVLFRAEEELGEQEYRLTISREGSHPALVIGAATDTGAMYGAYDVIGELGVRYLHPESTFYPALDGDTTMPWSFDGTVESPQFELRGFHEHTQHPIPTSDFYLRPEPAFRPYVSNYLKWLARNRQNVASFHMLKTVDLDAWEPYIEDIVDEAHAYGIDIGLVASFADQQQNNFIILTDPDESKEREQIAAALERFVDIGFDFVTFPIASSEFTKPEDDAVVRRLDTAVEIASELEPRPDLFAWVHISCELLADDGSIFWHLPERADGGMGTWVHTVMFHDLNHPAPVYDCEDFQHQKEFLERNEGERDIVYFPETAWWLGFDNNMPLALPITGWTRAYDINEELAGHDVRGHVTFTSGREWAYWQYDHFLTRATWETGVTWADYLAWIAPLFGEHGDAVADVLSRWAERQVEDFFETNPLVYFYLAGELRQDEIGAQAGILARRPKIPYRTVVRFDDEEFAAWYASDYELLGEMRDAYRAILDDLEAPSVPDADDLTSVLYWETYAVLDLYVKRIDHALALYAAVIEIREWELAKADGAAVDGPDHARLLAASNDHLGEARALSQAALDIIETGERFYRYPGELMYGPKPESLTSYPFGYLDETHTAHFWTRRDDQLADLIDQTFFERPDVWANEPADLYYSEGDAIALVEPDNPVAESAITAFVPRMLFGIDAEGNLVVGQDHNENFVPDRDTEVTLELAADGAVRTATADSYTFVVRNSVGEELGAGLTVFDPLFTVEGDPPTLVILDGQVAKANLINLIVDVGGIDADGAETLLAAIFKVGPDEELPALLPFVFSLSLSEAPI